MADTAAPAAVEAVAPRKAGKSTAASKKPRGKRVHPKTSEMVNKAIKSLKERGGSSLQAIKKFISANYKVDAEKLSPVIKKYIKGAITTGSLVQTKGRGASGSFKLANKEKAEKKAPKTKSPSKKKVAAPAKEMKLEATNAAKKVPAVKKPTSGASGSAAKKAVAAKKPAAAAKKPKSPSKAEKATKSLAAAKKPKPKKAVPQAKVFTQEGCPQEEMRHSQLLVHGSVAHAFG